MAVPFVARWLFRLRQEHSDGRNSGQWDRGHDQKALHDTGVSRPRTGSLREDGQRGRLSCQVDQRRTETGPSDQTWHFAHSGRPSSQPCWCRQGMVHQKVTSLRHIHRLSGTECLRQITTSQDHQSQLHLHDAFQESQGRVPGGAPVQTSVPHSAKASDSGLQGRRVERTPFLSGHGLQSGHARWLPHQKHAVSGERLSPGIRLRRKTTLISCGRRITRLRWMPAIVGRAMARRKKTKKRRRKTTCRRTRSRTGLTPAVRKHADLLCLLSRVGPVHARRILASGLGDAGLLRAVAECSHNVLSGTVRLTPSQHKRLRRHKTALRRLTEEYRTRKRHSKKDLQRHRALLMRGGFLGSLLGVVGPLIAGAVGKLIANRKR